MGWLREFSQAKGLYTVEKALALDNLLAWQATWSESLTSSWTRKTTQSRLRAFLRYASPAGWIAREPILDPIKIDEPETQPLTDAEYSEILKHAGDKETWALIQLMRWSGLAVRDAATLKRADLVKEDGTYKIIRERAKTGTDVYIPLKPDVAKEVLAVLNGNPVYVFWNKLKADSSEYTLSTHWRGIAERVAVVPTNFCYFSLASESQQVNAEGISGLGSSGSLLELEMMAIMTKIKHMGHRILGYSFTLIQLWYEGTRFTPNEIKFL